MTASTIVVGARDTSLLPTSKNTLTVSTSSTETGAAATLTLSYTTVYSFLETSWFYIYVPKANVDYSSNSGQAVSLISDSDKALASVTIGGISFTVNSSSAGLDVGSGYTYDTWYFTFSTTSTFTADNIAISITVPITNPEYVSTLSSDWLF